MDFFYDASGMPFAVKYNGDMCYYITNLQGDVMSIVDAQGAVVASYSYDPYGNVLTATGTLAETNPLRYRGYYFDTESRLYYLQSRYYDPIMGRFINADAQFDGNAGLAGSNLFSYCANSPVSLKDISGFAIETALDIASAIDSFCSFIVNPSWANAGYLAWDIAAAVAPFIPASYVAKGGKLVAKVARKIDDLADGSELLTGSYNALKKMCKGVSGVEVHHLIEKRFRVLFKGSTGKYLSVVLSDDMHQIITNRWRNLHKVDDICMDFAYGSDYRLITFDLMVQAVNEVYHDMPDIMNDTISWLNKNWRGNRFTCLN